MTEDGELQVSFEESLGLQFEAERIQSFVSGQPGKQRALHRRLSQLFNIVKF